ncbi:MAG: hypothetical protein ACP5QK_01580 [Myxococcota bacterium]
MSLLKKIQSIFILGFLFAIHMLKYLFVKRGDREKFISRFKSDKIDVLGAEEINKIYEAGRCSCCNMCSIVKREKGEYDGAELSTRLSRDPTLYSILKSNVNYNIDDCPYGLDVNRISTLIT